MKVDLLNPDRGEFDKQFTELNKLQTMVASAIKEVKEKPLMTASEADAPNSNTDFMNATRSHINDLHNRISQVASNLYDYASRVDSEHRNYRYDHQKGHLPSCKTASQMKAALKSCDMADDYEVQKGWVSTASYKKGTLEFDLDFRK